MRVTVTGASGLLGSNLCTLLCKLGYEVICTKRVSSDCSHLKHLKLNWVNADLGDLTSLKDAFKGSAAVFHCAALVGLGPQLNQELHRTNVVGTQNVLSAVRAAAVDRLIHCSSVDALGLPQNGVPSNESSVWNWDQLGLDFGYARTKFQSEQLVLAAAAKDIDAVVVNPTFMLGPLDSKPSSGRLVLKLANGWLPFYPNGANNFVDVRDVANAMLLALERGKRGQRYILGGENMSYREFFERVIQATGRSARIFAMPRPMAQLAGYCGDVASRLSGVALDLNSENTALGYIKHIFSSEKAQRELGYVISSLDSAIEAALTWFYSRGMLRSSSYALKLRHATGTHQV